MQTGNLFDSIGVNAISGMYQRHNICVNTENIKIEFRILI